MKIILDDGTEIRLDELNVPNMNQVIDNTRVMIETLEHEASSQEEMCEVMRRKIRAARRELDAWLQLKDIMERRQRQINEIINQNKGESQND
jgi:flagellar biosynthesis chaperone FliJ